MEKNNHPDTYVTIIGYVDPVDDSNKNKGVMITTEDDKTFTVDLNKEGKRLQNLIGEKVKARGTATQKKSGNNRILVDKFEVIEWQEPYVEDMDYQDDEEIERFES